MSSDDTKRALRLLWREHLRHAAQIEGDEYRAETANIDETPQSTESSRWDATPHREWKTYYEGGREKYTEWVDGKGDVTETRDRVGLERNGWDGRHVTLDLARSVVKQDQEWERQGDARTHLPHTRPDRLVQWDPDETYNTNAVSVWQDARGGRTERGGCLLYTSPSPRDS